MLCAPQPSAPARTPRPGLRRSGTTSMSRRAGWRRSSSEPCKLRKPKLDQRPDRVLEPSLARDLERLLVALPRLRRVDSLFEPVVPRHEQLLDPHSCVVDGHPGSLTTRSFV